MFGCDAHTEKKEDCYDCLRLSRPLAPASASGYTDDYVEGLLNKVEFHNNIAVELRDELDDVKEELKTLLESDDRLKQLSEERDEAYKTLNQFYCVRGDGQVCTKEKPCSVHELEATKDRLTTAEGFIETQDSLVIARINTEQDSTARADKAEEKYESMKVFYEKVVQDLHGDIRMHRITSNVLAVLAFGLGMWVFLS